MTTTTGWSPASGESEEGETEILQGGADSPQDLVDIHIFQYLFMLLETSYYKESTWATGIWQNHSKIDANMF